MKTIFDSHRRDFATRAPGVDRLARELGNRVIARLLDDGRPLQSVSLEEAKRLLVREWRDALT